jgi:mannosyltransferase
VGVALAAVAVGLVLRFAASTPLWLDEALSVNLSALPLGEIPEALRHDGHPPLYYAMLHGWIELFGSGDTAVRSLSGLLSVASLPLAYVVGRIRGDRRLAWLLVLIISVSPFALRFATETRMYSLIVLLTLLGYIALDAARRSPTPARLLGVAMVSGLLLLTHYWTFYLVGAVGLLLGFQWWRSTGSARADAGRVVLAVAAGGVLFLPWLPSFLTQASSTGTPWAQAARPSQVLSVTLADQGGGSELPEGVLYAVLVGVLVVIGLLGRNSGTWTIDLDLRTRPEYRIEASIVALTLGLGVLVAYASSGAFAGRYASVFFVPLALLMAAGLHRIGSQVALGAVLGVLLLLSGAGAAEVLSADRTQAVEWAGAIDAGAGPDDVVIYCPDQLGPAGSRLVSLPLDQQYRFPDGGDPRFVDWADYAERNRASDPQAFVDRVLEQAGEGAVWLVISRDYETFEGKCDGVQRRLARARQGAVAVPEDGAEFLEHGAVVHYPAR